jgi:hypothetical protein
VGREIPQHAVQTALLLEDIKDQPDDTLGLLVGVQLVIAVEAPHIAQGRLIQEVPALGLVAPALEQAPFHDVEFGLVHHATQSQQ